MRLKHILTVLLPLICFSEIFARVYDEAKNHNYIYAKSVDSSIDYRNAQNFLYDTARFKRDMRDNRNRNPGANQFWLVYKSVAGFNCLHTRVFYLAGVSDETHFYIGRNQTEKREITPSYTGATTATGGGWVYRDYYFTFPDQTYFWEIHFADWYYAGLLNYWGVQVPFVSFFEAGDPTCGDRVCGGNDFLGRPETCATCPTDCGACPTGVCGNGRCEFGESWAPRTGEFTSDLGPLTCPEDCNFAVCGNERCDSNELCASQTWNTCSGECCTDDFTLHTTVCGNAKCDGIETCSSCPQDCGVCPTCGDGTCNGAETCYSCARDCGACPARVISNCVLPGYTNPATPVAAPITPPVTPPVTPPISPPVTPPTTPPVAAPVTPPVATPVATPVAAPLSAPPSGVINLPGVLRMQDFSAYNDVTPANYGNCGTTSVDMENVAGEVGCAVGWLDIGDWLRYTVNFNAGGTFDLVFRYSYPANGTPVPAPRTFTLQLDGGSPITFSVPPAAVNDWSFNTYTARWPSAIPAGSHTLTFTPTSTWWRIVSITFRAV